MKREIAKLPSERRRRKLLAGFEAYDQLATMVADGQPRRPLPVRQRHARERARPVAPRAAAWQRVRLAGRRHQLRDSIQWCRKNVVAVGRFDAQLQAPDDSPRRAVRVPVHVIVTRPTAATACWWSDRSGAAARRDREERAHGLAQAQQGTRAQPRARDQEPARRHPRRGAAAGDGVDVARAHEYTQVIIHEADRLQALVDRLLAPHRRPHVVGDVNIHEICERVRSLILAEFPRGLAVERDYDISIPEFRGDREQLIQAVLNIAHNAARRWPSASAVATRSSCCARASRARSRSASSASDWHWNCISDNGRVCPSPSAIASSIPWCRARRRLGSGLTLAQTFVQQHHGTIECDSDRAGPIFKIYPACPERATTHAEARLNETHLDR
jgi:two-component system nitrogen regulation sensor histidine kinase GlnL